MNPTIPNTPARPRRFSLIRVSKLLLFGLFGLVLTVIILASVGLIIDFLSDWNYSHARAKLEPKIISAGFPPTVTDQDQLADQADLSFKSPDGAWTVTAQWIKGRGYNWGVINNKTEKVYFRTENIQSNNAFPCRCVALWSPDSRYVAVTSDWGQNTDYVDVINVSGIDPTFTSLSISGPNDPAYPLKKELLKPEDAAFASDWMEQRTDALKWQTPTDLMVLAFWISA
jgi:hypothetical protein